MISNENEKHIQKAIITYNKFVNNNYLVVFHINKEHPLSFLELTFKEKHFWHLVGCKIDPFLNLSNDEKHQIYEDCLNQKNVSKYLKKTDEKNVNIKEKASNLIAVLDFISNAKIVKIADTKETPEINNFEIALGNDKGIIGYSNNEINSFLYFPKSSENKSIYSIDKNANQKIIVILKKDMKRNIFSEIEFEVKKDIFQTLLPEFLKNHIPLSDELKKKGKDDPPGGGVGGSASKEESKKENITNNAENHIKTAISDIKETKDGTVIIELIEDTIDNDEEDLGR